MGGTLSEIFKGSSGLSPVAGGSANVPLYGTATPAKPSLSSKMIGSGLKGALTNFMQPNQQMPGSTQVGPGPAPAPVDPSFFQPTNYGPMMSPSRALYGGQ